MGKSINPCSFIRSGTKLARLRPGFHVEEAPNKSEEPGSKKALVVAMLDAANGVTLAQIMAATGWQKHSVRGSLSGAVGKKMGLTRGAGQPYAVSDAKCPRHFVICRLFLEIDANILATSWSEDRVSGRERQRQRPRCAVYGGFSGSCERLAVNRKLSCFI